MLVLKDRSLKINRLSVLNFILFFFLCITISAAIPIDGNDNEHPLPSLANTKLIPITVSSIIEKTIFHPVDTLVLLKQRLNKNYSEILKENNLRILYRGMFYQTISAIPLNAVGYGSYFYVQKLLKSENKYTETEKKLLGGIVSGTLLGVCACPFEAARARAIFLPDIPKPQSFFRYYYRGISVSIASTMAFSFCVPLGSDLIHQKLSITSPYSYKSFMVGLFTGALSQIIINPLSVLKVSLMTDYKHKGLKYHIKKVFSTSNPFRGALIRSVRHGFGIGLVTYLIPIFEELIS
ncbi:MAG: hypothetical protein Q8Q56_00380 [Alphaproteobacteria bacterium]|nr:hypothetical protein [Alphaproteobacteria bacterium]